MWCSKCQGEVEHDVEKEDDRPDLCHDCWFEWWEDQGFPALSL